MILFEKYWKPLTFVPIIIFVIAVLILGNNLLNSGFIIDRDVELSGGKQLSFEVTDVNVADVKNNFPNSKVNVVRGLITVLLVEIQFDEDENDVIAYVESNFDVIGDPTLKEVGPALGRIFWQQTQLAFIIAFISMSILNLLEMQEN